MAWWDDAAKALGDAVASGTEALAGAAETVCTAAGDFVADVVESAGNGIADGATALGDVLAGIPGIGGFLEGTCDWLGGIVAGATNFVGGVVKAVFGIVAGVLGGLIRIIGGILCLNGSLILKGLIDIGSCIAGAVLIILGTLASLVQRIIFCQNKERTLTKAEYEMLRNVFHLSISLYNIRIIEGWSGIFGITTSGAFTLGNTIYANTTDFSASPAILVHECVHVWQYQVLGPRYTMDALGAQAIYGRDGGPTDAYAWEAELGRGHTQWQDFNKEAAAKHIDDIWSVGSMNPLDLTLRPGSGTFFLAGSDVFLLNRGEFIFNGTDYSDLAIASVKTLRNGVNFRMSKFMFM